MPSRVRCPRSASSPLSILSRALPAESSPLLVPPAPACLVLRLSIIPQAVSFRVVQLSTRVSRLLQPIAVLIEPSLPPKPEIGLSRGALGTLGSVLVASSSLKLLF